MPITLITKHCYHKHPLHSLRRIPMNPVDSDEGTPVSVKIRERIQAARKRFHANDNIAEFIRPGELELLLDEVEEKMKGSKLITNY